MTEEKLPIFTPEFWHERLISARKRGHIHVAVYDVSVAEWERVTAYIKEAVLRYVKPGDKVLDAGCGYGWLSEVLPKDVSYVGVDGSPHLIEEAKERFPDKTFLCEKLEKLPFIDKRFDWAVGSSIEGVIIENISSLKWLQVEAELCRVAKKILLIGYGSYKDGYYFIIEDGKRRKV